MIEKIEIEIFNTGHITNCYLIYDENKEALIIDPADKAELIEEKIKELNLKPKYILLTHGHADHVFALEEISNYYNIPIIANINEKGMFNKSVNNYSEVFGKTQKEFNLDKFIFKSNNEYIKVGNMVIKMIETPGHTGGSCCYFFEKENILVTGDTLFSDCFGRCDLETGSIDDMIDSLINLYKKYKGVTIYPGHNLSGIKIEDTYEYIRDYLKRTQYIDLNDILTKEEK